MRLPMCSIMARETADLSACSTVGARSLAKLFRLRSMRCVGCINQSASPSHFRMKPHDVVRSVALLGDLSLRVRPART